MGGSEDAKAGKVRHRVRPAKRSSIAGGPVLSGCPATKRSIGASVAAWIPSVDSTQLNALCGVATTFGRTSSLLMHQLLDVLGAPARGSRSTLRGFVIVSIALVRQ